MAGLIFIYSSINYFSLTYIFFMMLLYKAHNTKVHLIKKAPQDSQKNAVECVWKLAALVVCPNIGEADSPLAFLVNSDKWEIVSINEK